MGVILVSPHAPAHSCAPPVPPPQESAADELAGMAVDAQYRSFWALLPEEARAALGARGLDHGSVFGEAMRRARGHAASLLVSRGFLGAAARDERGLQAAMRALVAKRGWWAEAEVAEGLLALRSSWDAVDDARTGAALLGWLAGALDAAAAICAVAAVSLAVTAGRTGGPAGSVPAVLVFLSALGALLAWADAALSLAARGRRLHDLGLGLESAVWRYRTRTGEYAPRNSESASGDCAVRLARAAAAASAAAAALQLPWPPGAARPRYRHGQYSPPPRRLRLVLGGGWRVAPVEEDGVEGGVGPAAEDDHYSRLSAKDYVGLRVRPTIAELRRQLPARSAWAYALSAALVGASASGVVLAHLGADAAVAILAAAAAAVATWRRRASGEAKVGRRLGAAVAAASL